MRIDIIQKRYIAHKRCQPIITLHSNYSHYSHFLTITQYDSYKKEMILSIKQQITINCPFSFKFI